MLCLGLGIVAVCVLAPQAESNRKLAGERDKLQRDLTYVQTQVSVNEEFIKRVGQDPGLSERLAQRQMQEIRQGSRVLKLKGLPQSRAMSPFLLVNVAPPPAPRAYQPPSGIIGRLCENPKHQLYLSGLGMFLIAAGLVMGASAKSP
jgi:hypothetical protein